MLEKEFHNIDQLEASQLQDKLRHYLKKHRRVNKITSEKMAENVGYNKDHYKTFEMKSPKNRFIKSLDFIIGFSSIEKMAPHEFIAYIFSIPQKERKTLYSWESSLLKMFGGINILRRREFSKSIENMEFEEFEKYVELFSKLMLIDEKNLKAITTLTNSIASKRN